MLNSSELGGSLGRGRRWHCLPQPSGVTIVYILSGGDMAEFRVLPCILGEETNRPQDGWARSVLLVLPLTTGV